MRRNKEKVSKPVDTIDTLIGTGTVINGDLLFTGGLRIDGHIKGNISAQDSSKDTLVLSDSGVIDGDVSVAHVVINGTVNGNISSSMHVELQSKAKISGDIHYKAVEMELGAMLNGNLVSDATSAPSVQQTLSSDSVINVKQAKEKKIENT